MRNQNSKTKKKRSSKYDIAETIAIMEGGPDNKLLENKNFHTQPEVLVLYRLDFFRIKCEMSLKYFFIKNIVE